MANILNSTSFSALGHLDQDAVRQLFDNTYQSGKRLKLDPLELFRQQKSVAMSLSFYSKKLETVNEVAFHYMSKPQRDALQQDLLFTFYLLSAEYQLSELNLGQSGHRQKMRKLGNQIKLCARLINELRKSSEPQTPESMLTSATDDDSERHLKYLGLTIIAPMVIAEEALTEIQSGVGYLSGVRSQWGRSRGIFVSILEQLSDNFINKKLISQKDTVPSTVTGYMSWILQYAYLGIDLTLLLKHTFRGRWMNKAERDLPISTRERFQSQWNQRKISILGSLNWAIGFMVCFYWLVGNGTAGYVGNILTIGFLLVDVGLSVWQLSEENSQYKKDIARYKHDIDIILTKIGNANNEEQKEVLQLQLNTLVEAREKCNLDWKYKKYKCMIDVAYAAGLVVTFSLMFCFLLPPALIPAAMSVALKFISSVMYFVYNLVYSVVNNRFEGLKSKAIGEEANTELSKLLCQFNTLKLDAEKDLDGSMKKKLYLDMKQLASDINYQKRFSRFQTLQLVRALLVDTLAPSLLFAIYMFTPIGLSIAALAAVVIIAAASKMLLKKPSADELPTFNEEEYRTFLSSAKPTLADLENKEKPLREPAKLGFFNRKASSPVSDNIENTTLLSLSS